LRLAAKRTPFSSILHCILLQIAQKQVQMAIYLNKNSFCRIHMLPPFASKTTIARIDYLRQGERLVSRKGTHNVKIYAEKKTKNNRLTS